MRKSKVLDKLRSGGCAFSTQIGSAFAPFAGMAAQIGFDCVWLDMEHKPATESQVRECILAAAAYGADSVVRILKRGYLDYFKPLEAGAAGVMVPHCMSQEEAQWAVRNSKFYPVGLRGMDFTGYGLDYNMKSPEECVEHALSETFVTVQIEDIEALERVEEIAETEGVDILFIGPADLTQSAKKHGRFSDDFMESAYKRLDRAAASAKDTWWGTVSGSAEAAQGLADKGARFINVCGDFAGVNRELSGITEKLRKSGLL